MEWGATLEYEPNWEVKVERESSDLAREVALHKIVGQKHYFGVRDERFQTVTVITFATPLGERKFAVYYNVTSTKIFRVMECAHSDAIKTQYHFGLYRCNCPACGQEWEEDSCD